jgi:hypothetical protein
MLTVSILPAPRRTAGGRVAPDVAPDRRPGKIAVTTVRCHPFWTIGFAIDD